jgi:ABC-type proline/glycine betaine transport system permease subunit
VGIDSTNLSCSDVAGVELLFTVGFLLAFFTTFFTIGFVVVLTVGTGTTGFFVTFAFGVGFCVVEGMTTFVDDGPLPLRPSMTI